MKKKKELTILKAFFSLSLILLFSSAVTRAFPWPIKGKAGHPMRAIQSEPIDSSRFDLDPHKSTTQTHR